MGGQIMQFCGTQTISVVRVEMKLVVTPNRIAKVDLEIVLNRILTHIRTSYGDDKITSSPSPWTSTGID
jgi:hypothetical protein